MTDPARIKALENLVATNLIEKARRGDTLTATDYRAISRLATDAGLLPPLPALPWLHARSTNGKAKARRSPTPPSTSSRCASGTSPSPPRPTARPAR